MGLKSGFWFGAQGKSELTRANDLVRDGEAEWARHDYPAAQRSFEQALIILRRIHGNEDRVVAAFLIHLGRVLASDGKFDLARQNFEEALAIRRRLFNWDSSEIEQSLSALGELAGRAGDLAAAQKYLTELVTIRRRTLGSEHPDLAVSLHELGAVLNAQNEFDLARQHFDEALAIRRLFNGNSSEITRSLSALGRLAFKVKDYASARLYWTEVVAILRRILGSDHPDLAVSLHELGAVLSAQNEFELARQHFEEALAIRRRLFNGDSSKIAQSLIALGRLAFTVKDYASARLHGTEVVEIVRRTLGSEHPDLALELCELGVVLKAQDEFDLARQHFEEALAIRRRLFNGDSSEIVPILSALGVLAFTVKDYASARLHWTEVIEIVPRTLGSEHPDLARALRDLGTVLIAQNEFDQARQHFEEALAIQRRLFNWDHTEIERSLSALGDLATRAGNFAEAQKYLTELVRIRRQTLGNEHPELARALRDLGAVLLGQDKPAEGYPVTQAALDIFRSAYGDDHIDVVVTLNNLGFTLIDLDRYVEAKQCLEQALTITSRHVDTDELYVAKSLRGLGRGSLRAGDLGDAYVHFSKALTIQQRRLGNQHIYVARTKNEIGAVLMALGDYEGARQWVSEAESIRQQAFGSDDVEGAVNLNNLGTLSKRLNDFAEAARCHKKALAIARRVGYEWGIVISLHHLCGVLIAERDFSAARECGDEALAVLRRIAGDYVRETGPLLGGLGQATPSDDEAAFGYFIDALFIAMLSEDFDCMAGTCYEISKLLHRRGAFAAAVFFGKQAVNTLQRVRGTLGTLEVRLQKSFLTSKESTYRHLAAVLVDAGRLGEVVQIMSLLKMRELSGLLHQPFADLALLTSREAAWKDRGDKLAEELAPLAAEEARTRGSPEHQAVADKLEEVNQRFKVWLDKLTDALESNNHEQTAEIETLNREALAGLQSDLGALGPDVALLQYVLGPERLNVIVTTPTVQFGHELAVTEQTINRLVFDLRSAIERRDDLNEVLPPAQELYRHLIAPVASTLEQTGIRTLMVALDGVIRYMPLAALHDGRHWLIERYALAMLTPAAPRRLDQPPSPDWRVAGFGVTRSVRRDNGLQGVVNELNGIVRVDDAGGGIYPGAIYLDDAFTEDALAGASHDHQAIHIASHFVFKPANELASYLITGDGRITLERFKQRPFDFSGIDLITLSACETAMGGGRESGREVEGFGALVQKQGAKAVIATLWPVRDWTTEYLMRRFYQERRERKLAKAAALRIAQLELLYGTHGIKTPSGETRGVDEVPDGDAPYFHPYYWAPFILMGNWL